MSIFNYFLDTVVKPRYDTEYAFQSMQPYRMRFSYCPYT
ncbi:palindromic element RPE4 domain-containing protein [Rickettsia sp. R2]|uniref:Palindromic element RPE4 domain-containing protein n=1 Tax=Rickettsia japonica TaxID=35790 RepID=A0ABM6YHL6_RICJA|nr:palindromic element RPE4 domain-containing protein [Rickettsia japonica]QHE25406.1 palindromic element RPE4 domain-containing protein [Rickettsia japonica]